MYKKIIVIFFLKFLSFFIFGQTGYNALIIHSPEEIQDTFAISTALFTNVTQDSLSGTLLLCDDAIDIVTDGCSPIIQDMSEKIGLVDRGQCTFADKVGHARDAGAIAVIICNNESGGEIFPMGGEGDFGDVVAVMLSYEDCLSIKPFADQEINATFSIVEVIEDCDPECTQPTYPEHTVWGQQGEGSFACGLGEWSTIGVSNDTTVWVWDQDGVPFPIVGNDPINSETKCNGAALMDFYKYNIDQELTLEGVTPHADLISPVIDLTDVEWPIVHFTQLLFTASLESESAFITYSIDGGSTWKDTITIPSKHAVNSLGTTKPATAEQLSYYFCNETIGNEKDVRIKFIGKGDFYHWLVDDVYITNGAYEDISIDPSWVGGLPNYKTPSTQIDSQVPLAFRIINNGNIAYENLQYKALIQKDEQIIYEYQGTTTIGSCEGVKDIIIPELWSPQEDVGNYRITIELTDELLEEEDNLDDNKVSKTFLITEKVFSKTDKEDNLFNCYSKVHNNTIANAYVINSDESFRPAVINTGIAGGNIASFDHHFIGEVREWVDDTNDNGKVELAEETILIASGERIYTGNFDLHDFEIPLDVHLEDMDKGKQYLAIVNHIEIDNPNPLVCANELFYKLSQGNLSYNHLATSYAFKEVFNEFRAIAFASFGETRLDNYQDLVLSGEVSDTAVWFVDLEIELSSGIEEEVFQYTDEVYPNPFINNLQISDSVESYEVYTLQGNKIRTKSSERTLNTSQWHKGIYLLVTTDKKGRQGVHKVLKESF